MIESKFEISDKEQEVIYLKMIKSIFKSLLKESIISEKEYELLISDINRTFNLS